jgi:formylglycine-generating enzyme required for sulfatase activity
VRKKSGSSRGLRGGSFNNNENNLRSSNRNNNDPSNENNNVGFRVARLLRATTSLPNGQIMAVEVPPP